MAVAVAVATAGSGSGSSGFSTTRVSVVSSMPAIDAALVSAERVTLTGSKTPWATRSPYSPVAALKPLPTTGLAHLGDDDVALVAAVLGDPAQRLVDRAAHDVDAGRLIAGAAEPSVEHRRGVHQRRAAAGDDALLDRRASRRDGVLDAVLLLLELDLGGRADLDHTHAAGQLGETLLELLAVPVGVGVLDLGLDLVDAAGRPRRLRRCRRRSWCCPW